MACRRAMAGWLLAISALMSGCGSSAPGEGARYEQIVKPANGVWAVFVTQARTWPGGTIPASADTLARHVVQTWEQVNRQLLARSWIEPARTDIAALVRADRTVCQLLERLPAPGAATAWWTTLIADFS